MRKMLYLVACVLVLGITTARAEEFNPAKEKAAVERTVRDYVAEILTYDPKKMPRFFTESATFLPAGRVLVTPEDVVKWAEEVQKGFKEKGYVQFEFVNLSSKLLGKNLALLSYSGDRKTKDGTFIEKSGGTLVLKKTDAGWKIVTWAGHPAEDVIKLD